MRKVVACIQSSYIPWKGYFNQISLSDEFIFYDDVQYTKEDWRSRNKIKTRDGLKWLTVPCSGSTNTLLCDVQIANRFWQKKHWSTLRHSYGKAKYFKFYSAFFEELYLGTEWYNLSDMNQTFIRKISNEILGLKTKFSDSREFQLSSDKIKEERWLDLLDQVSATDFIIGPSARNYLNIDKQKKIANTGINLVWMDYSGYPEYNQLYPPFIHEVSILDLIFNEGPNATGFLKYFDNE